jgi:hypothetical protein
MPHVVTFMAVSLHIVSKRDMANVMAVELTSDVLCKCNEGPQSFTEW